jgi:hypothetical protein
VFENRALRRIFGPKRDKTKGECRKLCKEELNDLYSPNISRVITSRMRVGGGEGVHVVSMENRRGLYRGLVGKLKIHNFARTITFLRRNYTTQTTELP